MTGRRDTVTVAGTRLSVQRAGNGPPVLLVHGLGGASTSWQPQIAGLAERGYAAIAPDLPGYGRSAKPDAAYSPRYFVDVLVDLLDDLGEDNVHVVGSSMGGHVSLELALRHPDRVDRLVAVAPAGVPPASFEGTPALARYRDIVDASSQAEVAAILEDVHPDELAPPEHGRQPAEILDYVTDDGAKRAFERSLQASAKARRVGPLLDELAPPTLVVWGQADPMIPWDVVRPVLAEASHPGVVVFEETGHGPHSEHPSVFNDLLAAFLDEGSLAPARRAGQVHREPVGLSGTASDTRG